MNLIPLCSAHTYLQLTGGVSQLPYTLPAEHQGIEGSKPSVWKNFGSHPLKTAVFTKVQAGMLSLVYGAFLQLGTYGSSDSRGYLP